jgi:hypothetical protein
MEVIPTRDPTLIRWCGTGGDGVSRTPGSVLVQFDDGTGTVLAGLPGYIGSITVEAGHVVNVSYVPSMNSPLWTDYQADKERVETFRAVAAAAARNGLLAVDRRDARRFGDLVRTVKRWDPTLGLYAALAYADVGLRDQARSVEDYMRADLQADLFDVVLLAGSMREYSRTAREPLAALPTVPFCPMLGQTWSFLRPRGVEVPSVVQSANLHRLPGLWTTFDRDGMAMLRHAVEQEELP